MRIETERLYLREMTAADYEALYAVLADSDIVQHYPYRFDEASATVYSGSDCGRCASMKTAR